MQTATCSIWRELHWREGTVTTGWSKADPAYLALMILALDERLRGMLRARGD